MDASAAKRLGLWLLHSWSTWGEAPSVSPTSDGGTEPDYPGSDKQRGDSNIGVEGSAAHRRTHSIVRCTEAINASVVDAGVAEQPKE